MIQVGLSYRLPIISKENGRFKMSALVILIANWLAAFYSYTVWVETGSDLDLGVAVFSFTLGLVMSIVTARS